MAFLPDFVETVVYTGMYSFQANSHSRGTVGIHRQCRRGGVGSSASLPTAFSCKDWWSRRSTAKMLLGASTSSPRTPQACRTWYVTCPEKPCIVSNHRCITLAADGRQSATEYGQNAVTVHHERFLVNGQGLLLLWSAIHPRPFKK
jgi:hypothetical protein